MHVYWKEMTRTGVRDDQNVNGLQSSLTEHPKISLYKVGLPWNF